MEITRIPKLNEDLARNFSEVASKYLKKIDPKSFLSVIRSDLSNDMSYFDVYVSIFPDLTKSKNFLLLEKKIFKIHSELFKKYKIRKFPEIRLHLDDSIEYSNRIQEILKKIET